MDLTEKTLDSREVFRGRIIRVRQDTVRLPNGKEGTREVVEHPGGVAVLAIDDEGRVLLVRQYRYTFGRVLTEIPAGKREPGEEPFLTARRELQEEVGATAGRGTELGTLLAAPWPNPGRPWAASSPRRAATARRCTSTWRRSCTSGRPIRTRTSFWSRCAYPLTRRCVSAWTVR